MGNFLSGINVTGSVSITGDGSNAATFTESGSGDFTIASIDDLRLDSGGNDVVLRGASSSEFGRLSNSSQNFIIKNITADKDIIFQADDGSGGTTTYFKLDGSLTILEFSKNLYLTDDVQLRIGTGSDLKIYHDATNSNIVNETGNLLIEQKADGGDIIFYSDDGSGNVAQYFRVDGGEVETRFLKSTLHFDSVKAKFGDGGDLEIYHDGSNSYIKETGTGVLYIQGSANVQIEGINGENKAVFNENGSVQLFYNNVQKFQTTSTGVSVTGTQTISTIDQIGSDTDKFLMSDSGEIKYVTGANLRSYIGAGTGSGDVVASGTPVDNQVAIWTDATTVEGNANMTFSGTVLTVTGNTSTEWNTAYTDRFKWNGQSTGLLAADGRTSLGGTTVGQAFFTLTNPSAVTFPRMNADNSVSSLSASDFRTAIGAGTSSTAGTVTSVAFTEQTGNKAGITLGGSSSWTTSGTLNIGLDIQGQTALGATAAGGDYLLIYDTSGLANKKVSVTNLVAAAPQGDVTASSTTTFTNKSGNISQWTNDSGYTTNSGTVTGTGVNQRIAYWTGTSSLSSDNGLTYNSTDNKLIFNGDYAIREDGSGTFELNCDGSDIITKINGFGSNGSMTFDENSIYTTASGFYVPSGYGISAGTTSTASGTIRATGNIIAYYSDERLKDFKGNIPDALDKVCKLNGYYYTQNEKAAELGYENYERQVGVSAQEVQRVMPEVIETAPISYDNDEDYLTVDYGRLVPLLIESIKELKNEIEILKNKSCGN